MFKILGHVPVRSLLTENAEHNAFMIFGGHRAITVSTGMTAEKIVWLAELAKASADSKSKPHVQLALGTLKNCSESRIFSCPPLSCDSFIHSTGSSEEGLETCGLNSASPTPLSQQRALANATKSTIGTGTSIAASTAAAAAAASASVRSNNAIHVCWHRGATVGLRDFIISSENQLSGYLLRKFKNSSGWQKLWVVFTSFCLFFYKNYQDEFALASLPLLGWVYCEQ